MRNQNQRRGFSLIEVTVAVALFALFAVAIYSSLDLTFKIVYKSRLGIIMTAALDEQLEIARNLPYEQVGTVNGSPDGVLSAEQTIIRNGVSLFIITVVRNIDDPYDGTTVSAPRDTAPADYKLVEVKASCLNCVTATEQSLSTRVSPKRLEGASKNGSLFIQVFNADGDGLSGASVRVTNSTLSPAIDTTDVTDSNGRLELVDIATSTLGYNITVTKAGYSTDGTISQDDVDPSDSVNPPATVAPQTVTEVNFFIDALANLTVNTANANCSVAANRGVTLTGEKLIGTDPDIFKINKTFTTDAGGAYALNNLEWDTFTPILSGSYNIAGAIPMIPWEITPGLTQSATLIVTAATANSLLVNARDAATDLPLSGASVQLVGNNYDETIITGVGYVNQTDWSGGGGQAVFSRDDKYWDGVNIEVKSPDGDILLKKSGKDYLLNGYLESSTFDLGGPVNFKNVIWDPLSQPANTSVLLQIATSNSSTPTSWDFVGPDGASDSYFTVNSTVVNEINNDQRYFRYKVFLSTLDSAATPEFSDFAITYVTACTPPGQAYFGNLAAGDYTLSISASGYDINTDTVTVDGDTQIDEDLSPL